MVLDAQITSEIMRSFLTPGKRFVCYLRDKENAEKITTGSFANVPEYPGGTGDWYTWGDDVLFVLEPTQAEQPTSSGLDVQEYAYQIPIGGEILALEEAAKAGDENSFIQVAKGIDWETRPPEDFLRAIQLAFAAGAHIYARQLATRGAEQYPGHEELEKYSGILAPPKVIACEFSRDSDVETNNEWLKKYGNRYRGQWVALENGKLLAAAPTLRKLISEVGRKDGVLFTQGI